MAKGKLKQNLNVRVIGPTTQDIVEFINALESVYGDLFPSNIVPNTFEAGFRCFVNIPIKREDADDIE